MRKFAFLSSGVLALFLSISLILLLSFPTLAIGEVSPTEIPETESEPDLNIDALIEESLLDLQNETFRSALAKMDMVIEADPSIATAYFVRAVANNGLGFTDNAIEDFTSAIELAPWISNYYVLRGDVYMFNGQWTDALLDYEHVITMNPLALDTYTRRSSVYYALGDSVAGDVDDLLAQAITALISDADLEALGLLDEAIQIGGTREILGSAYYLRSLVNSRLGDFDEVFNDYDNALAVNPNLPSVYLARGSMYLETGNTKAAARDIYNRTQVLGTETLEDNINIGETLELQMAYRRVIDLHFDGEVGDVLNISANELTGFATSDPLIVLLDPNGNPLVADDDSGGDLNALIEDFELPMDGRYTLVLSHAEGGYAGGFSGLIEVEITD